MKTQIRRKKWNWISQTLRKPHNNVTKQALFWNPKGKQNHGGLANNWRRSAEQELQQISLRWTQIERQAQDKEQWKKTVEELSSTQEPRDYISGHLRLHINECTFLCGFLLEYASCTPATSSGEASSSSSSSLASSTRVIPASGTNKGVTL